MVCSVKCNALMSIECYDIPLLFQDFDPIVGLLQLIINLSILFFPVFNVLLLIWTLQGFSFDLQYWILIPLKPGYRKQIAEKHCCINFISSFCPHNSIRTSSYSKNIEIDNGRYFYHVITDIVGLPVSKMVSMFIASAWFG